MSPGYRSVFAHHVLAAIERDGFLWEALHHYFPFSDDTWTGNEYSSILAACLGALTSTEAREDLLDALDLQYLVLSEQFVLQSRNLSSHEGNVDGSDVHHRVRTYLEINDSARRAIGAPYGLEVLEQIPAGRLACRIFGDRLRYKDRPRIRASSIESDLEQLRSMLQDMGIHDPA